VQGVGIVIISRPYFFWLLLLLVPFAIVAARKYVLGRREFTMLAGVWRLKESRALYSTKSLVVSVCSLAVFVFSVCALAGFQSGERIVSDDREGDAVVIALDISNSMLAEDTYPSRLAESVRAIGKLVTGTNSASFGLVIFKGKAINVWPLSEDKEAIRDFLDTVSPGFITSPGTNIGAAIDASLGVFHDSGKYNTIVLFTDGEDLSGDPLDAASRAARRDIPVISVLAGTEKGAFVPNVSGGFIKDDSGKSVVSKANRRALEEIARITKGKLVELGRNTDLAKTVFDVAEGTTAGGRGPGFRTVKNELFPIFLSLSLIFLALCFICRGVRWRKML
jgi:Ca-activated chloride channel family protein